VDIAQVTRDDIIAFTIGLEGGFVDNATDPGGATNWGVTQHYLNVARAANVVLDLPANVADLTQVQAAQLYAADQWVAVKGDSLPWPLALMAFDMAVNEGPNRAIVTLQQALGVTADGVLGPATLSAATSAGPKVVKAYAARRGVAYAQLSGTEGQFELQWMVRLLDVYTQALTQ
jgi:lysozyme family protein